MTDFQTKAGPGPLSGFKVVEYAVFHAGPGAAAILGDLGADVIKVETGSGDPVRHWKKVAGFDMSLPDGESLLHQLSNRGKRSIGLDIKRPQGREAFLRLVRQADVFVTNLRPGTKVKLGIDYASLSKVNPDLVQVSVSGYGPEGPMSDLGAYDSLGQAVSGLMHLTGSEEPQLIHLGVLDQSVAIVASYAAVTALLARERRKIGQEVHVSLYGTAVWMTYCNLMLENVLNIDPAQSGDRTHHSPLRNRFRCGDGRWMMSTNHPEDQYWPVLCRAVGRSDLIDDPRFAEASSRAENCPELVAIFDDIFARKTRDEWTGLLQAQGLLFVPIRRTSELKSDPQALANGYIVPYDHPVMGQVLFPGFPWLFGRSRADTRSPAPNLGQHTWEILQEAGYSEAEIEALLTARVITGTDRPASD
ncbi:MAG: CoA transferase [Thermodesulfobacteriota bacterium]